MCKRRIIWHNTEQHSSSFVLLFFLLRIGTRNGRNYIKIRIQILICSNWKRQIRCACPSDGNWKEFDHRVSTQRRTSPMEMRIWQTVEIWNGKTNKTNLIKKLFSSNGIYFSEADTGHFLLPNTFRFYLIVNFRYYDFYISIFQCVWTIVSNIYTEAERKKNRECRMEERRGKLNALCTKVQRNKLHR